jgi:molybdopterin biosynthesis enzyme
MSLMSFADAKTKLLDSAQPVGTVETIDLAEAFGRAWRPI